MERNGLVVDFLRLVASETTIPPSTIADVVRFAVGDKPTLRFALPPAVRHKLDIWASKHGLHGAVETVGCTRVGDWVCVGRHLTESTEPIDVAAYATTSAEAAAVCAAEHERPGEGAGMLLGYPACCVAAYRDYLRAPQNWISIALTRSGAPPYPCWANRLPIGWGGPTFVGELYPCALDCRQAAAIGKRAHDAMQSMGLASLCERTLAETLRPVPRDSPHDKAHWLHANRSPTAMLEFTT